MGLGIMANATGPRGQGLGSMVGQGAMQGMQNVAQAQQMQANQQMRALQGMQIQQALQTAQRQREAIAQLPEEQRQAVLAGVPYSDIWKRQNPEQKFETYYDDQGRERKGFVTPQGVVPVGGAKANVQSINLGGRTVFVDPTQMAGQALGHSMSPSESANLALSQRRLALDYSPDVQAQLAGAKTAATEQTKNLVEAQSNLPKAISAGQEALRQTDELMKHPGFKQAVGASALLGVQKVPGTDAYDFMNRLDQVRSGAFMTAFETLKGGGQITEIEGKKATDALARMDNATSEREFRSAVNDYRSVIQRAMNNAKMRAGGQVNQPQTPSVNSGWSATVIK